MAVDTTLARWQRKLARRISNRGLSTHDAFIREQRRTGTFVFIHINKCGGTSVEQALGLPKIHDTARARRDKLGAERWAAMARFSIVRHPYDKVASHYKYRIKTDQTGLAGRPVDLNEWVRRAYGDRDPAFYDKPLMFAPCRDWLVDADGTLMVDHVAKLETIDADWPKIQALIGTDAALPHANATRHIARASDQLDTASRAIIAKRFAPDFEMFGYDP